MTSAADFLPEGRSLKALAEAAEGCRGCELHKDATQTVFGVGRASARLMLVGEQPGDREDREGEPFVGPAGLEAEVAAVKPEALLAMGATAGRALFGSKVRVTKDRGRRLDSPLAPVAAITIHPSAILRLRDHDEREAELAGFVADLEAVDAALRDAAR